MPIIVRDSRQRPALLRTGIDQLSKMSLLELIAYEAALWNTLTKVPNSPLIIATMNAIYREVEYRAQDSEFGTRSRGLG